VLRIGHAWSVADKPGPVLLIHGGAGAIPNDDVDRYLVGLREALDAGWSILRRGGTALDAVEAAVVSMEDSGAFNAGRGSVLNQEGRVQLDAMIMDGETLAAGAVGAVETIRNPIRVARAVMERSAQVYFVGHGAERFARDHGFAPIDNMELVSARERRRFEEAEGSAKGITGADVRLGTAADGSRGHDTVGAVALDGSGNLAAGTSTGGIRYKPVGRVGDSSVVGSGGYADNETAAVSCTGEGEAIMRLVLGKWAVDRVADGMAPEAAAEAAIGRLGGRLGAHGGLILVDRGGRAGVAVNAERMAWGLSTTRGSKVEVARAIGGQVTVVPTG
jgi:L-asparaginase / beta-aspartyl-peptidase